MRQRQRRAHYCGYLSYIGKTGGDCLIAYGKKNRAERCTCIFLWLLRSAWEFMCCLRFLRASMDSHRHQLPENWSVRSRNGIRTWFSFTTFMDLSCRRNSYLTIWKKRESRWCGPFTIAGLTPGTVRSMIITTVDSGGWMQRLQRVSKYLSLCII